MAVLNYDKQCKYTSVELDNEIYLYPFNAPIIKYMVDTNLQDNGICTEIVGEAKRFYCDDVVLSVNTTSDNRFAFENKLSLKLSERANTNNTEYIKEFIDNKYLVVFKDKENKKWILNPEFPISMTYDYNITDQFGNICNMTLTTMSNVPTLLFVGDINATSTMRDKACSYNKGKVKSLQMASIMKTFLESNGDKLTITSKGNSLKNIKFDKSSLAFKETYNGTDFTQTLSFTIPFTDYKSYFHYDLLEYIDNKYYALIQTSNDNIVIGGYHQGLFPEFKIETSENGNSITITLTAVYQNYNLVSSGNYEIKYVEDITYERLFGECVNNQYTYTLLRKRINGALLDEYYCLEGYKSKYPDYNIVGEYKVNDVSFGVKLINPAVNCSEICFVKGLPTSIIFSKKGEVKTFEIKTACDVTFDFDPTKVDVTYQDGILTVTNKIDKGEYNITANVSDGTKRNIAVSVLQEGDVSKIINITAKKQVVDVILSKPLSNVKEVKITLPYSINQNGTGYLVQVPMNESTTDKREFIITVIYENGDKEVIKIIQDHLYKMLVKDGTKKCIDNDKWEMWLEKIGYYPDKIDIDNGYIKGQLYEKDSAECIKWDERNVVGTICVNKKLYNKVEYKKNGVVIVIKLELEGTACDDSKTYTKYIVNRDRVVCHNGIAFYVEQLWASEDDVTYYLVTPIIERPSNEQAPNSNICEIVDPNNPNILYRWVAKGDTACLIEGVEYNCEESEPIEYIEGDNNTYMCVGFDKFKINRISISEYCNNVYKFYGYSQGELIESGSLDCGKARMMKECKWFDAPQGEYICNGINKYNKLIEKCRETPTSDWIASGNEKAGDTLIESNSTDCGYAERWVVSGYTCEGTTKYEKEIKEVSTDSGSTYNPTGEERRGAELEKNSTDCGYVPPTPTESDLAFEYSGSTPMKYTINSTVYTATTSPFSVNTKKDLGIDTITDMSRLFFQGSRPNRITKITKLPDSSSVISLEAAFNNCTALTELNLSTLITSSVSNMSSMFYKCTSLISMDLSNWEIKPECITDDMFKLCHSLTSITMDNCSCETINRVIDELTKAMYRDNVTIYSNSGCPGTVNKADFEFEFDGPECVFTINNVEYTATTSPYSVNTKTDLGIDKITNIEYLFNSSPVTKINTWFDTKYVTKFKHVINNCDNITLVDLSSWDISSGTDFEEVVFAGQQVSLINFSNWKFTGNPYTFNIVNGKFGTDFNPKNPVLLINNSTCEDIEKIRQSAMNNYIVYSDTNCEGTYPPPVKENDLEIEFTGDTPMAISINNSTFNISESPYIVSTKYDLGFLGGINYFSITQGIDGEVNNITKIKLPNINQCNDFTYMFYGSNKLENIIFDKGFETRNKDMSNMFTLCNSLKSITIDDSSCETINSIISQLNTDSITGVTIYSNTGCSGTVPTPPSV